MAGLHLCVDGEELESPHLPALKSLPPFFLSLPPRQLHTRARARPPPMLLCRPRAHDRRASLARVLCSTSTGRRREKRSPKSSTPPSQRRTLVVRIQPPSQPSPRPRSGGHGLDTDSSGPSSVFSLSHAHQRSHLAARPPLPSRRRRGGAGGMRKSKAAAAAAKRPHHAAQNGHALPSRLARYLDPDASLDKDQLLDAVHWIRQAVGLACGLLWGAVPLVGTFWIALCTDELRWGTERLSCAGADHVQRRSFQRRPGQTDDARLLLLVHVFIDLVLPQGEI